MPDTARQPIPNTYYDPRFQRQAVKLLPGEFYATTSEKMLVTVLGSCVSVCLRDTALNIAGMNHFLLPTDMGNEANPWGSSARYGMYAMELLINEMLKLGSRRHNLVAKVFGGGNVLQQNFSHNHVGARNVEFVQEYLNTEHIPVIGSDLLGDYARKIYFLPESGVVHMKKIRTLNNSTIFDRESVYKMRLREPESTNDVDFFT